ncbi:S1C family serine protease [Methanocella arvoryzae]|uniref:Trypsin-like protease n=1 Tax=Methanocella arvoryzae (strain DSM 22066 / NBRC 105507 / MRE50) TaxID=351160 RepID=Q0W0C0_METAR|nr:trypsin-like peptidase domain-containing protein [Methanocella arvoryzae]CAJ38173.1 putative trypsin-like protease [Methanocella arvoryzae MRE50]
MSISDDEMIAMIERVGPAVVNINTVRLVHDYYMNVVPLRGMGSGVIFDGRNGYILTNNHIIEGAESIEVTLFDGRKFKGKLIGTDPTSDIAVVGIKSDNLPEAKLGTSETVKVGQTAIAFGNPFGFLLRGPTVTVGVISALHRTIQAEQGVFEDLMQTDAHINPGNSGGPLVNRKGEIIGINSANIPFAQGIGFSIPVDVARRIAEELIEHGRIIRPWLGILGVGVTPQISQYYDLPSDKGILVTRVFNNSPAEEAGISAGDLILATDKKSITDMDELTKEVRSKRVGDRVTMVIQRGPIRQEVDLRLSEIPSQ